MIPSLVLALASLLSLAAAAPAVHLSEQHYRSNAQRGDALVFPAGGRRLPSADSAAEALAARCATGRLGASERWQILLLPDGAQQLRRSLASAHLATAVFFNAERNLRVRTPPCPAALATLRDHISRQHHERDAVRLERLDADSGGFLVVSHARADARLVVDRGVSVPIAHAESAAAARERQAAAQSREHEAQARARMAAAVRAASFASAFDALGGVATRDAARPLLSAEHRQHYVDAFASASATAADFAELQRDHLDLLLQEERELLAPGGEDAEASWSPAFSLQRWERLRQRTDAAARRALAEGWVTLARLALASSGDVARSVDCLRRAVQWAPDFAPAYVELSALLAGHAGDASASCAVMQLLLARAAGDAPVSEELLATHFAHCGAAIRVAQLWDDTSALLRFAAVASVVLSCVLLVGDWRRRCCNSARWRRRSSSASASASASSSARSRRSKRGAAGD